MSYVTHARAALTVDGRIKIARLVIEDGWTQARVAERFQVARGTVSKWVAHVLRLLRDELEIAMALSGCTSLQTVDKALIYKDS